MRERDIYSSNPLICHQAGKEDTKERQAILKEIEDLKKQEADLKKLIAKFSDSDPEVIAQIKEKASVSISYSKHLKSSKNNLDLDLYSCIKTQRTYGRTIYSRFRRGARTNLTSVKITSASSSTYPRISTTPNNQKKIVT